jgi:uncharacterized membrane protein
LASPEAARLDESAMERLPLSGFSEKYSVAERIALTDAKVRTHVSYAIVAVFLLADILTLTGVGYIFRDDNANIKAHVITPQDRFITPQVVMTIIGATTVQLGALVLTMAKYLYPRYPRLPRPMPAKSPEPFAQPESRDFHAARPREH